MDLQYPYAGNFFAYFQLITYRRGVRDWLQLAQNSAQ